MVEFVYLLIDWFTIFDTADAEAPVFPAISAMGIPYKVLSICVIGYDLLFFSSSNNHVMQRSRLPTGSIHSIEGFWCLAVH